MTYIYSNVTVGGESMAYNSPSAMCQTDGTKTPYWAYTNVGFEGGTSFAAPEVAGLAALVRDYFQQGFYPTGVATPANAITPSGSLVKAVILASGEDMATSSTPSVFAINKRYSSDVGYGRANLPGVLHVGNGAPFLWVQNNDTLGQGATKSFTYNINGNATPLRVMMTYYDAAGDALQKNADLRVTIGGNVYRGNVLSTGWSTTEARSTQRTTPRACSSTPRTDCRFGNRAGRSHRHQQPGRHELLPGRHGERRQLVGPAGLPRQGCLHLRRFRQHHGQRRVGDVAGQRHADQPEQSVASDRYRDRQLHRRQRRLHRNHPDRIGHHRGRRREPRGDLPRRHTRERHRRLHAAVSDAGFAIDGGCDNAAAGDDRVTGPLSNGGVNEFYTKYMDAGEYSSYTFGFINQSGVPLTDVYVALSFSGPAAAKMSALNGPIHVGYVGVGALAGGVFQLYTDPTAASLSSVNLDFDITSPADGYTGPVRLTQPQHLQSNDTITRLNRCSTFNASLSPFTESARTGRTTNPWRWSGGAISPATVSAETRTDGTCGSAVANAAVMTGNSGIAAGANFTGNADSVLLQNFQPLLTATAQRQALPLRWRWHSFYHASETLGATTGVWGIFYNDKWNNPVAPTGDQVALFTNNLGGYFYQTVFDYVGTWNWDVANGGTPDNPNAVTPAPNQLIITFPYGSATGSPPRARGSPTATSMPISPCSAAHRRRRPAVTSRSTTTTSSTTSSMRRDRGAPARPAPKRARSLSIS
jgi:hypothetical protein